LPQETLDLAPGRHGHEEETNYDFIYNLPETHRLTLKAYLATALTGLDEEGRSRVFEVSDLVSSVCKELDIELYEPRTATDPREHPDVTAEDVYRKDHDQVLSSDLVIHIADFPSTGAGEELDFAATALMPILLVAQGKSKVSRMVRGIPALKVSLEYADLDELRVRLRYELELLRPVMEERKLAFSDYDRNLIGSRVRLRREELELTRDEIVTHSNGLITTDRLTHIEENTDRLSNPSLVELRVLATILKTTVADLVEPDISERIVHLVQDWLEGKIPARYGVSEKDLKRIVRRILYRYLDHLDQA